MSRSRLLATALTVLASYGCFDDEIARTVGKGAENLEADVLTIQLLLNQIPVDMGGANPMLDPDGRLGPAIIA